MKNKITIILCLSFVLILMSVFVPAHHGLAQTPTPQANTQYKLLEPLPCNGTEKDGCVGGKLVTFDPTGDKTPALGKYLNFIIRLFIGLCAVLAVVMIVIGGIEYATSELISSKEAGKDRIRGALLGLLLALGAYTILFQINPDLLNTDVGISGATLSVIQQDFEIAPEPIRSANFTPPSGPIAGCTSGMAKLQNSNIWVCKDIAQNADDMIKAAKDEARLTLSGGGYRSEQEQIDKRRANCDGNMTDPHYPCHPPTAVPGHSMHESGLAIDLYCNGRIIPQSGPAKSNNPCFIWLSNNASRFHFFNLPSEGWHWSYNGK